MKSGLRVGSELTAFVDGPCLFGDPLADTTVTASSLEVSASGSTLHLGGGNGLLLRYGIPSGDDAALSVQRLALHELSRSPGSILAILPLSREERIVIEGRSAWVIPAGLQLSQQSRGVLKPLRIESPMISAAAVRPGDGSAASLLFLGAANGVTCYERAPGGTWSASKLAGWPRRIRGLFVHGSRLLVNSRSEGLMETSLTATCSALSPPVALPLPAESTGEIAAIAAREDRLFVGFSSGVVYEQRLEPDSRRTWHRRVVLPDLSGRRLLSLHPGSDPRHVWVALSDGISLVEGDTVVRRWTASEGVDLKGIASLQIDEARQMLWVGKSVAPLSMLLSPPSPVLWRDHTLRILLQLVLGLVAVAVLARLLKRLLVRDPPARERAAGQPP